MIPEPLVIFFGHYIQVPEVNSIEENKISKN